MASRTEGPWVVRQWGTDHDEWPDRRLSVGPGGLCVAISPRYPSDSTEADFALLAAAPKLLDALKQALEAIDTEYGISSPHHRLRPTADLLHAVLAKVEGK